VVFLPILSWELRSEAPRALFNGGEDAFFSDDLSNPTALK